MNAFLPLGRTGQTITLTARAATSRGDAKVVSTHGVAAFAKFTSGTALILDVGNWLHVGRINAQTIPAKMVDEEALGDFPASQFIGNAMRAVRLVLNAHRAVAATVDCASPDPAAVRVARFLRSSLKGGRWPVHAWLLVHAGVAIAYPAGQMLQTVRAFGRYSIAIVNHTHSLAPPIGRIVADLQPAGKD